MIFKLISMNGYGLFVWMAFGITILACGFTYLKTYKTLRKYEIEYAKELKQLTAPERKLILKKSKIASQVFTSYKKSI